MVTPPAPVSERRLLGQVLRWARTRGYTRIYRAATGFSGPATVWTRPGHPESPMVVVDSVGGATIVQLDAPGSRVTMDGRRPLPQILDVLCALNYLPARFGRQGRQALQDHAEVCERFAEHLIMVHQDERLNMRLFYAAGMYRAAESARAMSTRRILS